MPFMILSSLYALWRNWRYKDERDHPAANALVWHSMKTIAVQTIIYDVHLARTGNCDIGTRHECEMVGPWDWSNMVPNTYGTVSVHGAILEITENRVIVNIYLQELSYINYILCYIYLYHSHQNFNVQRVCYRQVIQAVMQAEWLTFFWCISNQDQV